LVDFHGIPLLLLLGVIWGSSTAGALIYAALSAYRQRRQPIGHRVDVFPAFDTPLGNCCSRSQLTLSDGQQAYSYKDLRLLQIFISNEGDVSFQEFTFGVALSEGDTAVFVEVQSDDRQHRVKQLTPISFAEPKSVLDFLLLPLNRGDSYSLRLWVLLAEGKRQPGPMTFSSPLEVRFVQMPTVEEVLTQAAHLSSIGLGPFQLSIKSLFK
jgi:hypothetical protein